MIRRLRDGRGGRQSPDRVFDCFAVFSSGAESPKCSEGQTLLKVKACNRVRSLPQLRSTPEAISRVGILIACFKDSDAPAKPRLGMISEFNGIAQVHNSVSIPKCSKALPYAAVVSAPGVITTHL